MPIAPHRDLHADGLWNVGGEGCEKIPYNILNIIHMKYCTCWTFMQELNDLANLQDVQSKRSLYMSCHAFLDLEL